MKTGILILVCHCDLSETVQTVPNKTGLGVISHTLGSRFYLGHLAEKVSHFKSLLLLTQPIFTGINQIFCVIFDCLIQVLSDNYPSVQSQFEGWNNSTFISYVWAGQGEFVYKLPSTWITVIEDNKIALSLYHVKLFKLLEYQYQYIASWKTEDANSLKSIKCIYWEKHVQL